MQQWGFECAGSAGLCVVVDEFKRGAGVGWELGVRLIFAPAMRHRGAARGTVGALGVVPSARCKWSYVGLLFSLAFVCSPRPRL